MRAIETDSVTVTLAPWEIGEIVQEALSNEPLDLDSDQTAVLYDIIYNAVSLTVERLNN